MVRTSPVMYFVQAKQLFSKETLGQGPFETGDLDATRLLWRLRKLSSMNNNHPMTADLSF